MLLMWSAMRLMLLSAVEAAVLSCSQGKDDAVFEAI